MRGRGRKKRIGVNGRGRNATSSGIVKIAFDESKRTIVANVGVARGKNVATAMHVPDPGPGPLAVPDRPDARIVPAPPVTRNALPPSPSQTAGTPERSQHPRKVLVSKEDSRNLADWLNKSVTPAELKGFADKYPIEFEKKEFSLAPPRLDDWMTRRLKESAAHKPAEAAEKT